MRKNIPTPKKAAMIDMRLTRAAPGNRSANFTYKGRLVDKNKLRRHIKDSTRLQRKSKAPAEITEDSTPISLEASKM